MTPKEKAKEIYLKFYIPKYIFAKEGMSSDWRKQATKRYALLNVDELINELNEFNDSTYSIKRIIFWGEVKKEIENI
jgi:hypothetical protein